MRAGPKYETTIMNESTQELDSVHPELPETALPVRRDGYHLGKIPCCVVLQNESDQNILVLNETGALIWRLCNGDNNVGGIIDMICESYPLSRDAVARDVYRSLDTFRIYELMDINES